MLRLTEDLACIKDIRGTCVTGRLYGTMANSYVIFTSVVFELEFDLY